VNVVKNGLNELKSGLNVVPFFEIVIYDFRVNSNLPTKKCQVQSSKG